MKLKCIFILFTFIQRELENCEILIEEQNYDNILYTINSIYPLQILTNRTGFT
jgi:hypothetical protein